MWYWLRRLKEDFKAWRRDEVRVAPGLRGRVYMRKSDLVPKEPGVRTKTRPEAKIKTRVYRASEDRWYKVNSEGGLERED